MSLTVFSLAQYLSKKVEKMRGIDYDATMTVKAVKGEKLTGTTTLTLGDKTYKFGPGKPEQGVQLFIDWAVQRIKAAVKEPIVFVPVPNSVAAVNTSPDFKTAVLAEKLAVAMGSGVTVARELWWKQEMIPAHKGGPRFADQVYPYLIGKKSSQKGERVLVDDVMTSGGHLQACATKLREMGHTVRFGFCGGRSMHEQLDEPFKVPPDELDDYDPDLFEKFFPDD